MFAFVTNVVLQLAQSCLEILAPLSDRCFSYIFLILVNVFLIIRIKITGRVPILVLLWQDFRFRLGLKLVELRKSLLLLSKAFWRDAKYQRVSNQSAQTFRKAFIQQIKDCYQFCILQYPVGVVWGGLYMRQIGVPFNDRKAYYDVHKDSLLTQLYLRLFLVAGYFCFAFLIVGPCSAWYISTLI